MPVVYLDGSDFDIGTSSLTITEAMEKPVVVFVHSESCIHCANAKPEYQKFAQQYEGSVIVAAVDINDARGKEFLTKMGYTISGVPDYLKFVRGKWVDEKPQGRNLNSLIQFAFNKNG